MTPSKTNHSKESDVFDWKRMQFRGNKVWLAMADAHTAFTHSGKVLIKYNLKQSYEYWVHPESVKELGPEGEVTPIIGTESSGTKTSSPSSVPPADNAPLDAIRIYTDGASSGNPGPAGAGVVLLYGKHRKEVSRYLGHTTNNVAELTAIKIALDHLKTTTKPVIIHTDSSYAIGVLTKGWKAKKNGPLITKIKRQMAQFKTISFVKVTGHAGIAENERADRLAVEAIGETS